jgi:hypothetical protein
MPMSKPLSKFNYMDGHKRCIEIKDGEIVSMFWEYPSAPNGREPFDIEPVLSRWHELHGEDVDFTSAAFLIHEVNFKLGNIIRDGVRVG